MSKNVYNFIKEISNFFDIDCFNNLDIGFNVLISKYLDTEYKGFVKEGKGDFIKRIQSIYCLEYILCLNKIFSQNLYIKEKIYYTEDNKEYTKMIPIINPNINSLIFNINDSNQNYFGDKLNDDIHRWFERDEYFSSLSKNSKVEIKNPSENFKIKCKTLISNLDLEKLKLNILNITKKYDIEGIKNWYEIFCHRLMLI